MNTTTGGLSLALYAGLLRVRPAQLADALKVLLGVKRRAVADGGGRRFWVDPASIFGLKLLRGETHEPGLTRAVLSLLRPGDAFLDVGGNEGYFSVLASGRVGEGRVDCFEPQTRLQAVLRENARLNGCSNLHVRQLALADRDGEAELFLRPSLNTGASSLTPHWRLGRRREAVRTTTLDEFVRATGLGQVRLVKVDCEGAEHRVIAGAAGVLARRAVDAWAMEFHPHICGAAACASIHQTLLAAGYRCADLCGHRVYCQPGIEADLRAVGDVRWDCDWRD
jgi:FkbM family methyltransferase